MTAQHRGDFGLPLYLADNLAVAFKAFDSDKNGYLDASELQLAVAALLPDTPAEVRGAIVRAIFASADSNADGKIDFGEFVGFVEKKKQSLDQTVESIRHVARGIGNAFVVTVLNHLTPPTLSSMFHTFTMTCSPSAASKPISSSDVRFVLRESFVDLPEPCAAEVVSTVMDVAARLTRDEGTPIVNASLVAMLEPFEHIKFQSKRKLSLNHRIGSIAALKGEDSSLHNPLNHLTEGQLWTLAKHVSAAAAKIVSNTPTVDSADGLTRLLRDCFAGIHDSLLEEVITAITNSSPPPYDVYDFLHAIQSIASNKIDQQAANVYSLASLDPATQTAISETLGLEEIDLLRDTFVRLDTDGDGFVSFEECARVSEDVLERKFSSFAPYLRALLAIADKDGDGRLSLSEFLMSFVDGPGVVPQEVITACVATIRLRLADPEMVLVQQAFRNMDVNCDGGLDFKELLQAIQEAMKPSYPSIGEKDYNEIADVILSKADRDLDGKINLAEFVRSIQEDQGVIPLNLIEHFGSLATESFQPTEAYKSFPRQPKEEPSKHAHIAPDQLRTAEPVVTASGSSGQASFDEGEAPLPAAPKSEEMPSLDAPAAEPSHTSILNSSIVHDVNHFNGFEDLLSFLTETDIGQINNALVKHLGSPREYNDVATTRDFLTTELQATSLEPAKIRKLTDIFVQFAHRNGRGELSIAEVIRRFCLGQIRKPKKHSVATADGGAVLAAAPAAGLVSSIVSAEGVNVLDLQQQSVSEVFVPSAETNILQKMFSRFDTNHDRLLIIGDIAPTQSRLLHERNPQWSKETVQLVIEALFAAADRDGDEHLSFEEFAETFRSGYGLFPDDYVHQLSEQILLDLSSVNLNAVYRSLLELLQRNPHGWGSAASLGEELEGVLAPFVEDYAKVRTMVDYILLYCPQAPHNERRVALEPFLEFMRTVLLAGRPNHEAAAEEAQPPAMVVKPPTVVDIAPYEWFTLKRIIASIGQSTPTIEAAKFRAKVEQAVKELMLDDSSLVETMTDNIVHTSKTCLMKDGTTVDAEMLATIITGAESDPKTVSMKVGTAAERQSRAVETINGTLQRLDQRRSLAEALLQVDTERSGEVNFVALQGKLHDLMRDLSEADFHKISRALRFVGEATSLGTFSISSFLRPFATAYFVEPASPLPVEGLLRWLSTKEEKVFRDCISSLEFEFDDPAASVPERIESLSIAFGAHLVSKGLQETVSLHDIRTLSKIFAEVAVCGEASLAKVQEDAAVIHIPWTLMPSRPRCEYALRKLRLEVGEAPYMRKIARSILLTDRHRNGVFSSAVLSEAVASELRLLRKDWEGQRVNMTILEWLLASEMDEKGFVSFGRMIDVMLELYPVLIPSLVGEIRVVIPLEDPDALAAALYHLSQRGEVPAIQLKVFSSEGNGPVTPILNFFSAVGWNEAASTIDFGSIYPACRFSSQGMTVLLSGLPQNLAQAAIFHALPIARQRDLACAFTALDKKKDNVLDYDELEGSLVQYERTLTKAASRTPVRSGKIGEVEISERSKRLFKEMDQMQLGLITVEDFLCLFCRSVVPLQLLEAIINSVGVSFRPKPPTEGGDATPPKPTTEKASHIHNATGVAISNDDLTKEFNRYDINKNGYLSRAEFAEAYRRLEHFGLIPSIEEINRLFNKICADPQKMTFDEFCLLMLRRSRM